MSPAKQTLSDEESDAIVDDLCELISKTMKRKAAIAANHLKSAALHADLPVQGAAPKPA